jgi:arylsulfatase A-like enzyme
MTMRTAVKYSTHCLALLLAWGAQADSLQSARPNIILVMTDDQGMGDLACLGNPVLRTPHLDRFYALSTRFTDFHVSPTCALTRAAIICGRHEFRSGVTHTAQRRELMNASYTTLPEVLAAAGYATGIFGKWHLGEADAFLPDKRGFSEVLIHGGGAIGKAIGGSCSDFPPNFDQRYFDNVLLHNDTIVQTRGFCTDVFFQGALGWIKQQYDANRPFFAYIAPNAPHSPFIAPAMYQQRFIDLGWDVETAGRYGMIENIDDNFGRLMHQLDEWQAWPNTLVIFMTDNGQAGRRIKAKRHGERVELYTAGYKTGKGSVYEGGTHVPAFWRWQGVLGEGVDIGALCAHIDLLPTLAELAGAPLPDGTQPIEGRTLRPLLENPAAAWPDRQLFIHRGRWAKGVHPQQAKYKGYAVRTQRWRMVGAQLYDISQDPYEQRDLAAQYPEVIERLGKAFDRWWAASVPLMINEQRPLSDAYPLVRRYHQQLTERGIPEWQPLPF